MSWPQMPKNRQSKFKFKLRGMREWWDMGAVIKCADFFFFKCILRVYFDGEGTIFTSGFIITNEAFLWKSKTQCFKNYLMIIINFFFLKFVVVLKTLCSAILYQWTHSINWLLLWKMSVSFLLMEDLGKRWDWESECNERPSGPRCAPLHTLPHLKH